MAANTTYDALKACIKKLAEFYKVSGALDAARDAKEKHLLRVKYTALTGEYLWLRQELAKCARRDMVARHVADTGESPDAYAYFVGHGRFANPRLQARSHTFQELSLMKREQELQAYYEILIHDGHHAAAQKERVAARARIFREQTGEVGCEAEGCQITWPHNGSPLRFCKKHRKTVPAAERRTGEAEAAARLGEWLEVQSRRRAAHRAVAEKPDKCSGGCGRTMGPERLTTDPDKYRRYGDIDRYGVRAYTWGGHTICRECRELRELRERPRPGS